MMTLEPIITSTIETDLYKINMLAVVLSQFNMDRTRWAFRCRNKDVKFTPEMITEIRAQIDWYCQNVRFTAEDIAYLKKACPWLKQSFLDFLRFWRPFREEIFINEGNIQPYNDCGLAIECVGPQTSVMMYEIPILAIVNEVYFAFKYGAGAKLVEFQKRAVQKFEDLKNGKYDVGVFSEFGLRRRYSKAAQDWLVNYMVDQKIPGFVGTSNVYLAKKYGVRPIGTCAHEMFQLLQGHHEYNPAYVNRLVMKAWTKEFKTSNGIMLTDCITTDCFLLDFDETYAKQFDGVRHDSGDPIAWGEKILAHYKKFNIDATQKTLLFSDSLDFERATRIKKYFEGRCKIAFGIGTWLANDCGIPALNIVHKMVECNGAPVAKISDVEGKGMCRDSEYVDYLKRCIDWRLRHEQR